MRMPMIPRMTILAILTAWQSGCAVAPTPLIPARPQGPATYICYGTLQSSAEEIRARADQQCGVQGLRVTG